jgi:hypothetical protein
MVWKRVSDHGGLCWCKSPTGDAQSAWQGQLGVEYMGLTYRSLKARYHCLGQGRLIEQLEYEGGDLA